MLCAVVKSSIYDNYFVDKKEKKTACAPPSSRGQHSATTVRCPLPDVLCCYGKVNKQSGTSLAGC